MYFIHDAESRQMGYKSNAASALTDSVLSALPMINDRLTGDRLDRGAALIATMAGGLKGGLRTVDLSIIPREKQTK